MECDGDCLVDGGGGNDSVSSTAAAAPSSQIASTRAKLYIEEALSNDDPSCVSVCDDCVATARSDQSKLECDSNRTK